MTNTKRTLRNEELEALSLAPDLDAVTFIIEHGSPEAKFGYRLGGMVCEFSESGFNRQAVMTALDLTTDPVWKEAARELASFLNEWAKE